VLVIVIGNVHNVLIFEGKHIAALAAQFRKRDLLHAAATIPDEKPFTFKDGCRAPMVKALADLLPKALRRNDIFNHIATFTLETSTVYTPIIRASQILKAAGAVLFKEQRDLADDFSVFRRSGSATLLQPCPEADFGGASGFTLFPRQQAPLRSQFPGDSTYMEALGNPADLPVSVSAAQLFKVVR
jgi:hypothetical protein